MKFAIHYSAAAASLVFRAGQWGVPWMIAFEYGGVGPLWEAVTEPDVLKEQVPRLSTIIKG